MAAWLSKFVVDARIAIHRVGNCVHWIGQRLFRILASLATNRRSSWCLNWRRNFAELLETNFT